MVNVQCSMFNGQCQKESARRRNPLVVVGSIAVVTATVVVTTRGRDGSRAATGAALVVTAGVVGKAARI